MQHRKEESLPHTHIRYFAEKAFLAHGWAKNVLITVDNAGWIINIVPGEKCSNAIDLNGPLLPGMLNLHSHAFQRAMAGLAEQSSGKTDSFWTWRQTMYQFLAQLLPEDQQAIAAQLYVEMLKAGYTTVGEFHYVHHQPDGTPYQERALTSHHIITAAMEAGISITHLPVLYAYSGFGGQEPSLQQRRFINDEIQILDIISSLNDIYKNNPQVVIGLAHHSLRAVTPGMLREATKTMHNINPKAPIHIHIAEQMKEVNDCIAWSGLRPVEWLLKNMTVDERWCLVHATHMTNIETKNLAHSGAVVGLCPTTEANLGDGFFNLPDYIRELGRFGIGSDSNISVSMIEELRLLEYGQRLREQKRAVVTIAGQASVGASLYRQALSGGAQALGKHTGTIEIGKRADFIALDPLAAVFVGKNEDKLLDTMIFAGNINPIRHVIAGGRHVVKDFCHLEEDKLFAAYKKTIKKIT